MEMIEDALDFTELDAGNVMVPRTEIVAIQENTPLSEAINIVRKKVLLAILFIGIILMT